MSGVEDVEPFPGDPPAIFEHAGQQFGLMAHPSVLSHGRNIKGGLVPSSRELWPFRHVG
jgi:hypothetical protein